MEEHPLSAFGGHPPQGGYDVLLNEKIKELK
jgi:hypothetical protein